MWQQKSFDQTSESGVLYLVPTPIGNLEDMTFRAIRLMKEVDMIAAEDTRQTIKLCNHFEIETKLVSYHEHNKETSGSNLLKLLKEGKNIALVSDAGMPAISDPGYDIVVSCLEEKIKVIPLPGANAALTALVASGLPTDHFYFFGFLHRQKKEKNKELEKLKMLDVPIIFYEAPHRLKDTLQRISEVLGNRQISVCRELTKRHEEFIRGTVEDVLQWCEDGMLKGEFCLIVEGASEAELKVEDWWAELTVDAHIQQYIDEKEMSSKDAIKLVAKERGLPKREVYAIYHKE
ncbi:16S rRNA (cytidine(1402)-2'-O)-methyltransferase [Bacillus sp. FJAT-45350]|uniref:16S rRNA (cytidine(1402)-2'-O)-methyltransferase n=1 Tax=Bacillus sp. FJAT-45350 TaxID=2011014 RepID=UPI000BB9A960|nr:16S rRNA (cytidine(1402)-2'-O)-methyltransferase [Bacillus sp. FJAT-45350]